jgi:GxxExxY protein
METSIIYKEESYRIMGACFEVYKEKGCGFLEAVYQECLELEFGLQGILFQPRVELALAYKGRPLKQTYVPDFVCFRKIVLELKAVSQLNDEHRAQVHNNLESYANQLSMAQDPLR